MNNRTIFSIMFLICAGFIAAAYTMIKPDDRFIFEGSILASLHLLTLAAGLSGLFLRGIYLRKDLNLTQNLKSLFAADNFWGVAAILWIITGLLRAFAGYEKGTDFYVHNPMFHAKMGLWALAGIIEIWPMITFIGWRRKLAKGQPIDFKSQKIFEKINLMETILIVLIVFVAGFMARGIWG